MDKELKKLKFKYSEYLIGDKKSFSQILSYTKNKFNLIDSDRDNPIFSLLDSFIRRDFLYSSRYMDRLKEEDLELAYFIIENNNSSRVYYSESNPNNYPLYLVFDNVTENFTTNSPLLKYELSLYKGISENDIKNNTTSLMDYLLLLDNQDMMEKLTKLVPNFITPEDKKNMLENFIINHLNNL